MEDGVNVPGVVQPIVTPVEHTGGELVEPVVDIASRVGTIEEKQKNHELELLRQIGDLETRLGSAYNDRFDGVGSTINDLERRLAEMETRAQETVETPVAATLANVDMPPAPKEKRRGIRGKRKSRRDQ